MAWVLLPDENEGQDKRVESGIVPCLDAGSTPASSTSRDLRLYTIRDIVAHMNLRRDLALRLKHRFASVLIGSNITGEDC